MVSGSPAARAGLRPGDLVLTVDDLAISGMEDLQRLTDASAIGRDLNVSLYRGDQAVRLTIRPTELAT